jgi:hypothetical protein
MAEARPSPSPPSTTIPSSRPICRSSASVSICRSAIPGWLAGSYIQSGHSAVTISTAAIAEASLEPSPTSTTTSTGRFSGIIATFEDPNPLARAAEYTAVIDWGDGTISAGIVQRRSIFPDRGSAFTVWGSHAYRSTGNFVVTVTLCDVDGGATTARSMVFVTALDENAHQPILGDLAMRIRRTSLPLSIRATPAVTDSPRPVNPAIDYWGRISEVVPLRRMAEALVGIADLPRELSDMAQSLAPAGTGQGHGRSPTTERALVLPDHPIAF